MHTPIEKIVVEAEKNAAENGERANIAEQKKSVRGNIGEAFDRIRTDVVLPNYAEGSGEAVDVTVKPISGSDVSELTINGRLKTETGQKSDKFNIYRITSKRISTDTMVQPSPRYEVAVADDESETGYRTLALVDSERKVGSFPSGWDFGTENELTPNQKDDVINKGYYIDPKGGQLVIEVHSILAAAMEQVNAEGHTQAAKRAGQTVVQAQVS